MNIRSRAAVAGAAVAVAAVVGGLLLWQQRHKPRAEPPPATRAEPVAAAPTAPASPPAAEPAVKHPVQLTEVKGSVPSVRPWVRYEFVDPALEALPAGQKIMLRVGPVNERRLKARLTELRRALVARSTGT